MERASPSLIPGREHGPEWTELKDRVEEIQTRFFETRNLAMDALMDLIHDLKAAKAANASDAQLALARNFQRKAQLQ